MLLNGYLTFGAGRNDLAMANETLALESSYATRTTTFGLALSAVVPGQGYGIRPELAISLGRTWINDVGFTGTAYGLEDDTLALDIGSVEQADVMFRPEVVVPLEGSTVAESRAVLSFAPRLGCTQVRATVEDEERYAGAELGFSGRSLDGLTRLTAKVTNDWRDAGGRPALELAFEHRF